MSTHTFVNIQKGSTTIARWEKKKKQKMENLEKSQILERKAEDRKLRLKEKKVTSEPVGQIKHFNTELVIAGHG